MTVPFEHLSKQEAAILFGIDVNIKDLGKVVITEAPSQLLTPTNPLKELNLPAEEIS